MATRSGGGQGSTVTSLLDAAEHHFATDGFERASLRAVMRAAGADPGAVHYHFGGRPELAAAVLDRFLAPLNANRLRGLEAARAVAQGQPIPLPAIVEALVRPDLEMAAELRRRGEGRARLVGAIYLHPADFVTKRVEHHFGPVAARFQPELASSLPHLGPEQVAWRIRWIVFGTLGALLADPAEAVDGTVDELLDRLVPSLAAAIDPPTAAVGQPERTPTSEANREQ